MTATMHMSDNNRSKRPSLSEQINRLDRTLDGMMVGNQRVTALVGERARQQRFWMGGP